MLEIYFLNKEVEELTNHYYALGVHVHLLDNYINEIDGITLIAHIATIDTIWTA